MISFAVHFIRQHFLIIVCCVITALLWDKIKQNTFGGPEPSASESDSGQTLLTVDQLATFDGVHSEKLYLSILGSVYDVTKGAKHYGAGGSYNYFVGNIGQKLWEQQIGSYYDCKLSSKIETFQKKSRNTSK